MFMLMFALGLINFVIASFRLFGCVAAEKITGDRGTETRTRKYHKIIKHYIVTFGFFYLAFKL